MRIERARQRENSRERKRERERESQIGIHLQNCLNTAVLSRLGKRFICRYLVSVAHTREDHAKKLLKDRIDYRTANDFFTRYAGAKNKVDELYEELYDI